MGEEIRQEDCLGLINSDYMERLKCKVIFIANSTELKEIDDFNKVKEKTIDKTILFESDSREIIKEILSKSKNNFIKENIDWITKLYSFYNKSINIRIFQSVISDFEELDNKMKSLPINVDKIELMSKSLFLMLW